MRDAQPRRFIADDQMREKIGCFFIRICLRLCGLLCGRFVGRSGDGMYFVKMFMECSFGWLFCASASRSRPAAWRASDPEPASRRKPRSQPVLTTNRGSKLSGAGSPCALLKLLLPAHAAVQGMDIHTSPDSRSTGLLMGRGICYFKVRSPGLMRPAGRMSASLCGS